MAAPGATLVIRINVQPGDTVYVRAGDRGYRPEPITLRVTRVRHELTRYYQDEWVWLEGYEVDAEGREGPWAQVLVRVTALP